MEERDGKGASHHPLSTHAQPSSEDNLHHDHDNYSPQPPLPLPPGCPDTYVVQILRDQVYRVPPPVNAKIVKSWEPATKKKSNNNASKICLAVFLGLSFLALLVAGVVGTIHLVYKPKPPQFSITGFSVKQLPSPPADDLVEYTLSFQQDNTNPRMSISDAGGTMTSLIAGKSNLAGGIYPASTQLPDASNDLSITLKGSRNGLPGRIQKSLNDTHNSKTPVSLTFEALNIPMKISSWATTDNKNLNIICDFKVTTMGKDPSIVDESCESTF